MIFDQVISEVENGSAAAMCLMLREGGSSFDTLDEQYLAGYLEFDKTRLPIEYASKSDRLYLTDKEEKTVFGGVVFVKNQELFRTRQLVDGLPEYPEKSIEMNGLWLHPKVTLDWRVAFWAGVCRYLLTQEGTAFFSYDVKKEGLARFYESLPGQVVYDGPVKAIPGMEGESVEKIMSIEIDNLKGVAESLLVKKMCSVMGAV